MSADTSPPTHGHQFIAFGNSEFRSIERYARARFEPDDLSDELDEQMALAQIAPGWLYYPHARVTMVPSQKEGL